MWPDRRLLDLFGIELPIVLAPMAGAMDAELAIAVAQAGGLGSLPVAMLDGRSCARRSRRSAPRRGKPINLNFFTHTPPRAQQCARARLARAARALLRRTRHRSEGAGAGDQPHAVRRRRSARRSRSSSRRS